MTYLSDTGPAKPCRDDKDLDAMYRNQSRFGDPMAAYVKQQKVDEPPPVALPVGKGKKSGAQPALCLGPLDSPNECCVKYNNKAWLP